MPEIKEIGVVIASREMEFHYEDGTTESFLLKVGMPYEYGDGGRSGDMNLDTHNHSVKRDAPPASWLRAPYLQRWAGNFKSWIPLP